uniref:Uncharacterized protein n=1 Tax=viral metagenome TaxID=1070528 RepID=A0A6M3KM31_9ZZZZ
MANSIKGHCKHGEFDLNQGCPQCIEERQNNYQPVTTDMPDAAAEQAFTPPETQIVKVRYFSETSQELSSREYTYYSVDPLQIGDIVMAPVRDTTCKAKITAIDIPEIEIVSFKDKVKIIPASALVTTEDAMKEAEWQVINSEIRAANIDQTETETAIALRPGEDIEAHSYFDEATKMLDYAERRTIQTLDDAKIATDDLSIISRLKKAMETKRKEKLAPHEAEIKAIRDTYNYLMVPVLDAERITKAKQIAFLEEQECIRQKQEEINRKRVEAAQQEMELKGELSESVNLVEVHEIPERISTNLGVTGMVDHWVFEVVDFALVPNEYKVIDSAMLNAIAKKHHNSKQIPGIKFVNQPYLATRPR